MTDVALTLVALTLAREGKRELGRLTPAEIRALAVKARAVLDAFEEPMPPKTGWVAP